MKRILVVVGMLLVSVSFLTAQVKIDFKTEFFDKSMPMQAIKSGVQQFFRQNTAWLQVVETFEKYSVWIKELKIVPKDNNPMVSVVTLKIELRTPAMIGSGKLIDMATLQYEVNTQEPLPFDNPPEMERMLSKINKSIETTTNGNIIVTVINQFTPSSMATMALKAASLFEKKFDASQKTMGLLAGYYTTALLYDLLKRNDAFK